ncbi:hypothetical protein MLD38_037221 [Melastoma candidum]|uniref:Uncharacterized protein n=1 Tax=Melastoma candidum TaxID=119954 RepID=A0ACB9LME2_9MYRT|nr:hypothetical protein MLD38_037221 [Melastoma candidum]
MCSELLSRNAWSRRNVSSFARPSAGSRVFRFDSVDCDRGLRRGSKSSDFDGCDGGGNAIREMGFSGKGCSAVAREGHECAVDRSRGFGSSDGSEDEESEGDDAVDEETLLMLDSASGKGNCPEVRRSTEVSVEEMRDPLVKEVCRLMSLRSLWNPSNERELKRLLRNMKPRQVCAVILTQEDERVALKFFYWADRQWRYRHDLIAYYTLLDILSKTKLCQDAHRIVRLMRRCGIVRDPEAFGYLMLSYSRARKLRHALRVLTLMQKAGVDPNLSICNTTMSVLIRNNKLEKALKFMERMQLVGINPEVVTYNCLIRGYCNIHRVQDAIGLIDAMPGKGCPPDNVRYHTVLVYLCKEKKIEEVKVLLDKMSRDHGLVPDQVTYDNIIHALCKHGHGNEALEFLKESQINGFQVDKVWYTAVVTAFCKSGNMDKAKDIVDVMISNNCMLDVVTYTAVVDGYCRLGNLDQARKLLKQMERHGCKPNMVSYTAYLNGLCHSGRSLESRDLLNKSEEQWWNPGAITYSAVMHGLRREGKLSEASDVVREMIGRGSFQIQLKSIYCSNLFAGKGEWTRPKNLWKSAEERDVQSTL